LVEPAYDDHRRGVLLGIAADAIGAVLETGRPADPPLDDAEPWLHEPRATFVTLERDGALLGCIGTIEPTRPLGEDVAYNARQSAFADPRLPAISVDDFEAMSIKISVLSPLERLPVSTVGQLADEIRPGVDGVLLTADGWRATFLPAVWDKVADPDEFVALLLRKAGLRADAEPRTLEAWRYTSEEFGDPGPRDLPFSRQ
jgi:AmmeMemoRadiSam system protein A